MKSSRRSSPPVLRKPPNRPSRFVEAGRAALPSFFSRASSGLVATQRRAGELRGLRRVLLKNFSELAENAGDAREGLVDAGRGLAEVLHRRGGRFGEVPEPFDGRARAVRGTAGTVPGCGPAPPACLAPACGRLVACDDEFGDVFADRGERFQRLVGVDRQFFEHRVLAGEDREHLVEFLQGRVGAADDRAEVAAAAQQAGAEFVDDDREALAFGQPVDVVQQVGVDRAVGVGDGQVGTGLRLRGRRGSSSAGAAAACLRPAAGWGCSRRTSRRSGPGGGSCSWRRCGSSGSRGCRC